MLKLFFKYNTNKQQKAAMFGLDARIALIIFSSLSLVGGTALYKSVKEARMTALITQMREVQKAANNYLADTGNWPPFADPTTNMMDLNALLSEPANVLNWQGPYINGSMVTNGLLHRDNSYIGLRRMYDNDWGNDATNVAAAVCLDSSLGCNLWGVATNMNKAYAESIDKKIDGDIDYSTGEIRVFAWDTSSPDTGYAVFYRMDPYKN